MLFRLDTSDIHPDPVCTYCVPETSVLDGEPPLAAATRLMAEYGIHNAADLGFVHIGDTTGYLIKIDPAIQNAIIVSHGGSFFTLGEMAQLMDHKEPNRSTLTTTLHAMLKCFDTYGLYKGNSFVYDSFVQQFERVFSLSPTYRKAYIFIGENAQSAKTTQMKILEDMYGIPSLGAVSTADLGGCMTGLESINTSYLLKLTYRSGFVLESDLFPANSAEFKELMLKLRFYGFTVDRVFHFDDSYELNKAIRNSPSIEYIKRIRRDSSSSSDTNTIPLLDELYSTKPNMIVQLNPRIDSTTLSYTIRDAIFNKTSTGVSDAGSSRNPTRRLFHATISCKNLQMIEHIIRSFHQANPSQHIQYVITHLNKVVVGPQALSTAGTSTVRTASTIKADKLREFHERILHYNLYEDSKPLHMSVSDILNSISAKKDMLVCLSSTKGSEEAECTIVYGMRPDYQHIVRFFEFLNENMADLNMAHDGSGLTFELAEDIYAEHSTSVFTPYSTKVIDLDLASNTMVIPDSDDADDDPDMDMDPDANSIIDYHILTNSKEMSYLKYAATGSFESYKIPNVPQFQITHSLDIHIQTDKLMDSASFAMLERKLRSTDYFNLSRITQTEMDNMIRITTKEYSTEPYADSLLRLKFQQRMLKRVVLLHILSEMSRHITVEADSPNMVKSMALSIGDLNARTVYSSSIQVLYDVYRF